MHRSFAIGIAVIALVAAGCGAPGLTPEPPQSTPPPSTTAPVPPSTTASVPTPSQDQTALPSDQPPGPVVATRTSSSDGAKLTIELYAISRTGNLSELNMTLRAEPTKGEFQVADTFGDKNYSSSDFSGHTVDGIQLVDGKHSKLYLVASDGDGTCLCSRGLSAVFLDSGEPLLLSATYAAPPADVTAVDVRVPNFGVITNVPVA